MSSRDEMRRLARESIERGDATGWFEALYQRASGAWGRVPWADLVANPYLVEWLSAAGFDVVAFDVAATAIEACRSRWPESRVAYASDPQPASDGRSNR